MVFWKCLVENCNIRPFFPRPGPWPLLTPIQQTVSFSPSGMMFPSSSRKLPSRIRDLQGFNSCKRHLPRSLNPPQQLSSSPHPLFATLTYYLSHSFCSPSLSLLRFHIFPSSRAISGPATQCFSTYPWQLTTTV